MKKRVNISIGPSLHVEAVALGKEMEMDFSELVSSLLRTALAERKRTGLKLSHEVSNGELVVKAKVQPGVLAKEREIPEGFRLLADKPSRNSRCSCGSGAKYKRCCEQYYPLVRLWPLKKSCDVATSPLASGYDHEQNNEEIA